MYFGTFEGWYMGAKKNAFELCHFFMIIGHCLTLSYFPAAMLYFGAVLGYYYSAETKVFH